MPGKLCTGAVTKNSYLPKESKAFSEGLLYRAQGASAAYPPTDCPHATGTSAYVAWIAGWNVTHSAIATTVSQSDAPCVAVPTNTILA